MAIIYGQNDGSDSIDGTDFRDIIHGGSPASPFTNTGEDKITGDDGSDDIYGGDDDDNLQGQDGDDFVAGGSGSDTVTGGDNEDLLFGGTGSDSLHGGNDNDYLDGLRGADRLEGDDGNDTIVADAGDGDQVSGGAGTDLLIFHAQGFSEGVDLDISDPSVNAVASDGTIVAGIDQLFFFGSSQTDQVTASANEDKVLGRQGGDTLRGGDGDDLLIGGKGADRLEGGAGDDDLWGGASRGDKFVFDDNGGRDTAKNFETGVDVVDLTAVDNVHSLADLTLTDLGSSVEVDYGSGSVVLDGVTSVGAVSSDDFLFA